jgi:hypothetical protein
MLHTILCPCCCHIIPVWVDLRVSPGLTGVLGTMTAAVPTAGSPAGVTGPEGCALYDGAGKQGEKDVLGMMAPPSPVTPDMMAPSADMMAPASPAGVNPAGKPNGPEAMASPENPSSDDEPSLYEETANSPSTADIKTRHQAKYDALIGWPPLEQTTPAPVGFTEVIAPACGTAREGSLEVAWAPKGLPGMPLEEVTAPGRRTAREGSLELAWTQPGLPGTEDIRNTRTWRTQENNDFFKK